MTRPAVSVGIACFNAAQHLRAAVETVRAQTIADWEVVIVDDCSTDDSHALALGLAASDPRVRVERLKRNGGPAAARGRALALASGEWFSVLDSDDLMHPDRLRRLVTRAEEDGADLVADDLLLFGEDGRQASRLLHCRSGKPFWLTLGDYLAKTMMYGGGPDLGFLKPLFRRDFLHEHRLSYDRRLRVGEDDDLVLRALLAGAHYRIVPAPTYFYRRHSESISHTHLEQLPAIIACSEELRPAVIAAGGAEARIFERRTRARRRGYHYGRMIDHLKRRQLRKALSWLVRSPTPLPLFRLPLAARIVRVRRAVAGTREDRRPMRLDAARAGRGPLVWFCQRATSANIRGLEWFLESVWPRVQQEVPDARLVLPAVAARALRGTGSPTVRVLAFGPLDALDLAGQVAIFPSTVAGGEPPYLLEALAASNLVVATGLALSGVGRRPPNLVQADTADEFGIALAHALRQKEVPSSVLEGSVHVGGARSGYSDAGTMVRLLEASGNG